MTPLPGEKRRPGLKDENRSVIAADGTDTGPRAGRACVEEPAAGRSPSIRARHCGGTGVGLRSALCLRRRSSR